MRARGEPLNGHARRRAAAWRAGARASNGSRAGSFLPKDNLNRGGSGSDLWLKPMNRDAKQVLTEWLVYSAQSRNETAFKDLYDLRHADLRRFCISRLGANDGVDEILADAWLAIARGLGRLDDPACFPRWAFRIVEHRCADWLRSRMRARRREAAAANEAERLAPAPVAPADPPEGVLRLREAIAGLPDEQRQLVDLYYHAERSVGEIADVLDLPVGTVKSRLFSLRESLKRSFERKTT